MIYRLINIVIFILLSSSIAIAQNQEQKPKWEDYLDIAYQLTCLGSSDIKRLNNDIEGEVGISLSEFAKEWNDKFAHTSKSAGTLKTDNQLFTYTDKQYQRASIANLLLYLSTQELHYLKTSVKLIDELKDKTDMTEIAFWYYYIHAHDNIENKDSTNFIKNLFNIWLDVILSIEEDKTISGVSSFSDVTAGFYSSFPYLLENIAAVIIDRAILKKQMANLEPLGTVIWAMEPRMTVEKGYSNDVKNITKRIYGPRSDVYSLNYTVVFLKAEAINNSTRDIIDKNSFSKEVGDLLKSANHFYLLAYKWSKTNQGRIAAITDHLNLVTFVIHRMIIKKESIESLNSADDIFSILPGHVGGNTMKIACQIFDEASSEDIVNKKWIEHGFSDKSDYVIAMHGLWRAIMNLSLWTSEYYIKKIDSTTINSFYRYAPPGQAALLLYLNFFEKNIKNGYSIVVPDDAFFAAAIAAERLSNLYTIVAPFSSGMEIYNLSFARKLQSIELFPFNIEGIEELTLTMLNQGRINLYINNMHPIAQFLHNSNALQTYFTDNPVALVADLKELNEYLPKIIVREPTIVMLITNSEVILEENILLKYDGLINKIPALKSKFKKRNVHESFNFDDIITEITEVETIILSSNLELNNSEKELYLSSIEQLRQEVKAVKEAYTLLKNYPRNKKICNDIRNKLTQDVEHPIHTLNRLIFYENQFENHFYVRFMNKYNTKKGNVQNSVSVN